MSRCAPTPASRTEAPPPSSSGRVANHPSTPPNAPRRTRRTAEVAIARTEHVSTRPRKRASSPKAERRDALPPARPSAPAAPLLSPEEHLARALDAKTARSRGLWARRGLAARGRLDRTTHALLLRQLYLSHFELRRFEDALEIAKQSLVLRVDMFEDVLHQDAARAAAAMGDIEAAILHLRKAARLAPASRRAFHWWTLGSILFLAERYDEAVGALQRAARWGTRDKPLYQGHLAVARCASGEAVSDLASLHERLAAVPAGRGYGQFVLGMLSFYEGRRAACRTHLESFVERTTTGRATTAIALTGEVERARAVLDQLRTRRA
ncbi:MAG: tetratricopeptide repeat protein [Polyangiaceae bacterium]